MKARPCKLVPKIGYVSCPVEDATHVTLRFPCPAGILTLPIILKGKREGSFCWTWNGCVHRPTLKPSILTRGTDSNGKEYISHSWVNDGEISYLSDSTGGYANKKLNLLELDFEEME